MKILVFYLISSIVLTAAFCAALRQANDADAKEDALRKVNDEYAMLTRRGPQ